MVIHVPHASTAIPEDVRAHLLVDDAELAAEIDAMTDWHTDTIAANAAELANVPVVVFTNTLSRLVVDPERFPDEREEMDAIGMGAVYRYRSDLRELRSVDPARDASLLEQYFYPYSEALAGVVSEMLDDVGRCTIINLHSFPLKPLRYEKDQLAPRPGVRVGTDDFHTPQALRLAAYKGVHWGRAGLAENTPFAGTYVPLRFYGVDDRVTSVMVEVRRDLYLDGVSTLRRHAADLFSHHLARFLDVAAAL